MYSSSRLADPARASCRLRDARSQTQARVQDLGENPTVDHFPSQRPRAIVNALGPIGVASRALAGIALIVLPIVSHGLAVWDVIGALAVLPAISVAFHHLLTAAAGRPALSTGRLGSSSAGTWTINLSALVVILAIGTVLTYVTPIDAGAIWLFFGFSLLVAAVRRDAACEALAIPNALRGQRERTGCIAFAAVDSLEARRSERTLRRIQEAGRSPSATSK
jgi:hypothetical protein